jgi:hypothetical protein
MSDNPFMVLAKKPRERSVTDHAKWAELRESGLRKIAEAGVEVGDIITVCWEVSEAYGGETRSHTGELLKMDGTLHVDGSSRTPAFLQIGYASIHSVRAERRRATEKVKTCVCEGECTSECERMFVGKLPDEQPAPAAPSNPFMDLPKPDPNSISERALKSNPFMI